MTAAPSPGLWMITMSTTPCCSSKDTCHTGTGLGDRPRRGGTPVTGQALRWADWHRPGPPPTDGAGARGRDQGQVGSRRAGRSGTRCLRAPCVCHSPGPAERFVGADSASREPRGEADL